jgi:branched-subunit amino acid aminotransferase/4-amino-4-deoxychorismate lyase
MPNVLLTEPENSRFWYDGRLIAGNMLELAIDDPALLYGATVFTTLRVYQTLDHPLTQWSAHCDRLAMSLAAFGWTEPDWQCLRQGATLLMPQFPVLRLVVFPDGREWITGRALPADLPQRQTRGITAWLATSMRGAGPLSPRDGPHPDDPIALSDCPSAQPNSLHTLPPDRLTRTLPSHKTGNYLAPWLALQTARQVGAQEAILVNQAGDWLETSTGTLWGWCDDRWWTPPVEAGILPGLLRNHLIYSFRCQNEEVMEVVWNREQIQQFRAIAYTNCVMEIIPIHTVLSDSPPLTYDPDHPGFQKLWRFFRP